MAVKLDDPQSRNGDEARNVAQQDYEHDFNNFPSQANIQTLNDQQADVDRGEEARQALQNEEKIGRQVPRGKKGLYERDENKPPLPKPSSTNTVGKLTSAAGGALKSKRSKVIAGSSGLFVALFFVLGSLAPFGIFIQLKEVVSDWGDKHTTSAYSKRIKNVFKTRYFGAKTCSGALCKFTPNRIDEKELLKLREKNITPNVDNGRITSFDFEDSKDGGRVTRITPANFDDVYKNKVNFTNSLHMATASPRAIAWRGPPSIKKMGLLGVDRSRIPTSVKELREKIYGESKKTSTNSSVKEDEADEERRKRAQLAGDELEKEVADLKDSAIKDGPPAGSIPDTNSLTPGGAAEIADDVAKGATKGAFMNVLGGPDAACTVYNYIRLVAFASKMYQARDLIRYSAVFLTAADMAKAGKIDSKKAAFIAGILLKQSTAKDSKGKTFAQSPAITLPYYGKIDNAKSIAAFNNGSPKLDYTDNILNKANSIGGAKTCGFIRSWLGQGLLLVGGLFISGGSIAGCFFGGVGCAALAAGVGTGIAAQIAAAATMAYLKPRLVQILAGTVAPDPEKDPRGGYGAGIAIASGVGAFGGQLGRSSGLPLAKKSDMAAIDSFENKEIAFVETVENQGKSSIEKVMESQFTTQFANAFAPLSAAAYNYNVASFLSESSRLVGGAPAQLLMANTIAKAEDPKDPYLSTYCDDETYKRMGVATDAFCNPVYAMTENDITRYPLEENVAWLEKNGYIDSEANPIGDFLEYYTTCADGVEPIDSEANDAGTDICVAKNEEDFQLMMRYSNFIIDKNSLDSTDQAINDELGGSSETTPGEDSTLSASMRVASYNVKVANQTNAGDGGKDGWMNSSKRMPIVGKVVRENKFDVIGFQEVEDVQFGQLKNAMSGYSSHPEKYSDGPDLAGLVPIYWKSDAFSLVDKGYFSRSWLRCPGVSMCTKAPWVLLKHNASGSEFYYLNTHFVNRATGAGGSDPGGAEKREADSKQILEFLQQLKPDTPVFFVGDLNSSWIPSHDDGALRGDRARVPYCILTSTNTLVHAQDTFENKKPACPPAAPSKRPYEIDHIYTSPGVGIVKYKDIVNGDTRQASDHPPMFADIAGEDGQTGDWAWPIDKSWYDKNKLDWLGEHRFYSGTWTNGIPRLAADIGDPDDGSPIYAMVGGEVSQADLRSSVGGPHGLAIKSKIQGGELEIAYAHGPRTNRNTSYKTGDKIMTLGCLGNCSGAHLHLDISFNGKGICPQDIFLAMAAGKTPNLNALTAIASAPCGRE